MTHIESLFPVSPCLSLFLSFTWSVSLFLSFSHTITVSLSLSISLSFSFSLFSLFLVVFFFFSLWLHSLSSLLQLLFYLVLFLLALNFYTKYVFNYEKNSPIWYKIWGDTTSKAAAMGFTLTFWKSCFALFLNLVLIGTPACW